jgi:Ca2+-binding RTX toxin-like protein
VFAVGAGPQTIQTGSGADSITALLGGDTIRGGGGADAINVQGHTSADTFVYGKVSESANTAAHDTIAGFAATGGFHDLLDFSAINANLNIVGQLSGTSIAADSIGWTYSGGDAHVFLNNTASTLSTANAGLLEVTLTGVSSGLAADLFKA